MRLQRELILSLPSKQLLVPVTALLLPTYSVDRTRIAGPCSYGNREALVSPDVKSEAERACWRRSLLHFSNYYVRWREAQYGCHTGNLFLRQLTVWRATYSQLSPHQHVSM